MSSKEPARFFATAARGTEGILRDELREIGMARVRATRGGVAFGRHFDEAMRACLHSRVAVRVLERLATFEVRDPEALYAATRRVAIERVLDPAHTLAVRATVQGNDQLRHTGFAAQKVKDAIVDRLRERFGSRPSVARTDPDVLVTLHVMRDQAQLLLDVSGEPLHRRGYRTRAGEAPLKENLAAAVLRFAGWDRCRPLLDPMCGSGTFAIEAAQWSANMAAGLQRRFGFERWVDHDEARQDRWRALCDEARGAVGDQAEVRAADRDVEALEVTRSNAARAGIRVRMDEADVGDLSPLDPPGFVVINPPYGVRIGHEADFVPRLMKWLRTLEGHRVAVITPDKTLPNALRLRPVIEHTLYNGALECRLFVWDIPERRRNRA